MSTVRLYLDVQNLAEAENLTAALNGKALTGGGKSSPPIGGPPTASHQWLEYPVNPDLLKKGNYRFKITLEGDPAAKCTLNDLLLWVRYPESS